MLDEEGIANVLAPEAYNTTTVAFTVWHSSLAQHITFAVYGHGGTV